MTIESIYRLPIVAGGGTTTLPLSSPISTIELYTSGAVTLVANQNITYSGTPRNGHTMWIIGNLVNLNLDVYSLTLYGEPINQTLLENTEFVARATYSSGAGKFIVTVFPNFEGTGFITAGHIASDAVTTAKILDDAVTLAKLANITEGSIVIGGAANAPTLLDIKTNKAILIGNGTTVTSALVSGAIAITNAGVTSINTGVVTPEMLSFSLDSFLYTSYTLTTAEINALFTTPITLVAAPGANKYVDVISATIKFTYGAAVYNSNTTLQILNTGATTAILTDTDSLVSSVSRITKFQEANPAAAGDTQLLENTAVVLNAAVGNPGSGGVPTSTAIVSICYRIVETA